LADSGVSVLESKTGTSFPSVLASSHKLCGIGLRKKSVLGLKNIDVYAFGMPFYFLSTTITLTNLDAKTTSKKDLFPI